jgi:hypothetical protein
MVWHLSGPVQVRLMEFCCTYNEKCKVSKNRAMITLGIAVVCFEVSEFSDSKQTSFHLYVKIDKVQDIFGNGRSFPIWGVFRQV